MNIRLADYFGIKSFLREKIKPSPLKFGRNINTKKNIIKQKFLSKSPIIKNILPKINRLNSLNETKGFSTKKEFISFFNKEKKENRNLYTINTNKKFYMIPLRNSLTQIKREEKINFINKRINEINPSYLNTFINNIKNQTDNRIKNNNENKVKEIRKIINLYYSKNEEKNNHNITKNENKNENLLKEKDNQNINNKTTIKNSMFMTEMNFLIYNKNKRKSKNKEIKEIKEVKTNKENEIKRTNYDLLNFKELLKRIERDKKKIINNQNDIDNMIKTTKDTFNEIWKYNHH